MDELDAFGDPRSDPFYNDRGGKGSCSCLIKPKARVCKMTFRLSSLSQLRTAIPKTCPLSFSLRHSSSASLPERNTTPLAKKSVPVSTIPAGSPIKGLAYLKGETDPIAKPDEDYPSWLWNLLEPNMGAGRMDTPLRAVRRELNRENTNKIRKSNFLKAKK